ncbi:MAG: DUF1127 domain-containing protein [Polaromonas sp.]|uniref:DUF1127 domain-containing protein n=1 Tax=Polaromonas sp. TaxID=1869339 RepID=UPI00248922AC|nr:DUF1127 domain-containing protein [Polaromonas sp.]MDI1238745.1 DUF1127 domain-containing protein [Polaromonas sp.]MDI1341496.1 DUF1127 domain-containing protein [Polaromonas sp.]
MPHKTLVIPFAALARGLAQWLQPGPHGPVPDKGLQQSRAELAQMSTRELNDLGISRGDIPALLDDPVGWRRDRPG